VKPPKCDLGYARIRNAISAVRLSSLDVHVWSVLLDDLFERGSTFTGALTATEIAWMERSVASLEQQRQIMTRGLLRFILSLYLEVVPAAVTIEFETRRPQLLGDFDKSLRFNSSTSESEAMFAVARNREVGIELALQREVDEEMLYSSAQLTPGERNLLALMPPGNRSTAFYRLQARRCALAKAKNAELAMAATAGGGVTHWAPLSHLSFGRATVGRWTVQDIDAPAGYASALAAENDDWQMQHIRLVAAK